MISEKVKRRIEEFKKKTEYTCTATHPPTAEERADGEEHRQLANLLNKELENEVKDGKIAPSIGGFGGRVNPPYWADKSRQARENL